MTIEIKLKFSKGKTNTAVVSLKRSIYKYISREVSLKALQRIQKLPAVICHTIYIFTGLIIRENRSKLAG